MYHGLRNVVHDVYLQVLTKDLVEQIKKVDEHNRKQLRCSNLYGPGALRCGQESKNIDTSTSTVHVP